MEVVNVSTRPIVCTEATIEELKYAIANRMPIAGITRVVTHHGAHLDEIFTMYIMMRTPEGEKCFPGVNDVTFMTQEELYPFLGEDGFYLALSNGYFLFGTGQGPFDEHADRVKRISASQMMADYVGLKSTKLGARIYSTFLNYVNYEDRNGDKLLDNCEPKYATIIRPALIAGNIKKGWRLVDAHKKKPSNLIAEVLGFIENEIGAQQLFAEAIEEYKGIQKKTIPLYFLPDHGTRKPVLLIIESDNDTMVSAAKHVFSTDQTMKMEVLLKINSKGQFYISPMNGTKLTEVIKGLRVLLARKRKSKVPRWPELDADGSLEGIEEIFYHKDADTILNGSLTQYDVPGLIGDELTKEEVIKCIVDGLDMGYFASEHRKTCVQGICAAKDSRVRCAMHPIGYQRCHNVRKNEKPKK